MKMTIALVLSFSLLAGFYSNNSKEALSQTDIALIKEAVDKNEVTVTSWMAFTRNKISQASNYNDLLKKTRKFMEEHSDFKWRTVLEEEHQYVWHGEKTGAHGIREKLKVKAYSTGNQYEIALTHEAKGKSLTDNQLEWISQTFKNDKLTFYTVTGSFQSKKELQTIADSFVSELGGKAVEQLNEKDFVSVSAYSKGIDSELLTSGNNKINLQIGLRTNTAIDVIDLTIGTPIITTEY
ncbi:YwmB family TATA-box binding protein [Fredinandcohnia humi]